uniref:Uncharacterized protein n=1 Tax=Glossina palpalis gambiensis TaxID=67801 RepID=A0A1B0BRZ1_9MUSC
MKKSNNAPVVYNNSRFRFGKEPCVKRLRCADLLCKSIIDSENLRSGFPTNLMSRIRSSTAIFRADALDRSSEFGRFECFVNAVGMVRFISSSSITASGPGVGITVEVLSMFLLTPLVGDFKRNAFASDVAPDNIHSCKLTFIGLDALDFSIMKTSLRKLRLSVNCRVSLEEISICGFHVNSIVMSFCAGLIIRIVRLAIFDTGTSSNNTMDLPEKGAITTSVDSRHSERLLPLDRTGVILT